MVWDEQQWRAAHGRVFGHGPERQARIVAAALIADAAIRWGHELSAVGWEPDNPSDPVENAASLLFQAAREQLRLVDDLTFCQIAPKASHTPGGIGVSRALACVHPGDPGKPDPYRRHACPEVGTEGSSVITVEQRLAGLARRPPIEPEPWRLWKLTPDLPVTALDDAGFSGYSCALCLADQEFVAAMPDCSDPAAGIWLMCRCGQSDLAVSERRWLDKADYRVVSPEDFLPACHHDGFGTLSRPAGALDGWARESVADRWPAYVLPEASIGGDRRWRICARVAVEAISARNADLEPSEENCKALALAALALSTAWDGAGPEPAADDLIAALAAGPDTVYEQLAEHFSTVELDHVMNQNVVMRAWARTWPAGFIRQSGIGSTGVAEGVARARLVLPAVDDPAAPVLAVTPEQIRTGVDIGYHTLASWFDAEIAAHTGHPDAPVETDGIGETRP